MQANVGPTMLPGKGLSETPPDHRSTSEGCLWGYRKGCYKFQFFKYSTLAEICWQFSWDLLQLSASHLYLVILIHSDTLQPSGALWNPIFIEYVCCKCQRFWSCSHIDIERIISEITIYIYIYVKRYWHLEIHCICSTKLDATALIHAHLTLLLIAAIFCSFS